MPETQSFTAAQIAAVLNVSRQAIGEQLKGRPAAEKRVAGNVAKAWRVPDLPPNLLIRLDAIAVQQRCRGTDSVQRIETLLLMPRRTWQPRDKKTGVVIPLDKISDADLRRAEKRRAALKPFLTCPRPDDVAAEQWKSQGVDLFERIVGRRITTRQWDKLYRRAEERDNGAGDFEALQIYLLDRWKLKDDPANVVLDAIADDYSGLENLIRSFKNRHSPHSGERECLWKLVISKFRALVSAGDSRKSAARGLREFLYKRNVFFDVSRDALLKAFNRKLDAVEKCGGDIAGAGDRRSANGPKVQIPDQDIDLLRHSAATSHGGRIDEAWRAEYSRLSEDTRAHYDRTWKAPRKIHSLMDREKVDLLYMRHHKGRRGLREGFGGLHGNRWQGIPAMHSWAMDDVTANIQIAFDGGQNGLLVPQVIFVMDCSSRKIVGRAVSTDKGPTAALACAAFLDAVRKNNIPKEIWVENGFVFGESLLVNGKEDDMGRTVVMGLARFGSSLHHFAKMNPRAKAELERSFEALQRLMEKHPGYTGRNQMIDAPDSFKKEERLIKAGAVPATDFRYTFSEFVTVLDEIIEEYNNTENHGEHLRGLPPNEAFAAWLSQDDPPIAYDPALEFFLSEEVQIVQVRAAGVKFKHRTSGRTIWATGGKLLGLVGKELWAWVPREDASLVTFMNLDYSGVFTMEACRAPSAREHSMDAGSGILAMEIEKIREPERALNEDYKRLVNLYGNPRRDLLAQIRNQPAGSGRFGRHPSRRLMVSPEIAEARDQMEAQRSTLMDQRDERERQQKAATKMARDTGLNLSPEAIAKLTPEQLKTVRDIMKQKGQEI
jgi:hypothetical protein